MNLVPLRELEDIEKFAQWFMNRPICEIAPPIGALRDYDLLSALVVYRQPPYQVELVTVKANAEFDYHAHPNVDSVEVAVFGSVIFEIEDVRQLETVLRVKPGVMHRAKIGDAGGAFFSIQKWMNGVEPTAVGLDWEGSTLSKIHDEILRGKNDNTSNTYYHDNHTDFCCDNSRRRTGHSSTCHRSGRNPHGLDGRAE